MIFPSPSPVSNKKDVIFLHPVYFALAAWNLAVFALYGIDKWKSTNNQWRIKERTLILSAFLLGAPGALLGIRFFRHKTKHVSFQILLPLALLANLTIILGIIYFSI